MANLRDTDARPNAAGLRERNERLEAQVRRLRSSRRLLQNGDYGRATIPSAAQQTTAAPGLVMLSTSFFAVGRTPADVVVGSVLIPPRMTRCVVSLTGRVYAVNTTGGIDLLSARVTAGGQAGNAIPVRTAAGAASMNVATLAVLLEDLVPGSTFDVALSVWSAAATWTADTVHFADLAGSLGWVT